MITLHNLITVAPFSEDVRTELLEKEDSLSDGKKIDLINLCWDMIASWYEEEIRHRYEMALLEMAEGTKQYTQEDLDKISDDVFSELTRKLQASETAEDIKEVREKLEGVKDLTQQ